MARPIKDTPVLKGKNARRFLEAMNAPKPETKEAVDRAKATFEKLSKLAVFPV